MPAGRAGAGGVPGINEHHWGTGQSGLILDEPGLPKTLREVAIEALNLADTCEAGGDKISVILHRLKDVREAAVVECIAVVDELFSTVADVSWNDIAALKRKLHGVKRRKA